MSGLLSALAGAPAGRSLFELVPDLSRVFVVTNAKFAGDFQAWSRGYEDRHAKYKFTIINDGSTSDALPSIELKADGNRLSLRLGADGFEQSPLTRADLADEAARLASAGIELELRIALD